MNATADAAARLLARVDELDEHQARAALKTALLAVGELRPDVDPASIVTAALRGVERAMDAPSSATPWRNRPSPRPSSLRAS